MKSASFREGFTLIELILFFTISALMLAGMLVGVSGSINRQRYDEANSSLLDYLQSQYNLNDNVHNNRLNTYGCDASGISGVSSPSSIPTIRGASDCTVAGRVVYSDDGQNISSRPVYSTTDGDTDKLPDVAAYLSTLGLIVAPAAYADDDDSYKVMWQTTLYTDKGNIATSDKFGILILRLPTNGLTRTYVSASSVNLSDLGGSFWTVSPLVETLNLCVQTSGLTSAPPTGVRVLEGASTSNGVQYIPAGDGTCS